MAEKRMISSKITDHDNFTTLPASAQALYLHLVLSADDDGFCAQTNSAMLKAHAKKKDIDELVKRRYLIRFDSGVYAVKHWKMQNSIRPDRYHETEYKEEKALLNVKPNGSYTTSKRQPSGCESAANPQPYDGQSAANPQPSDNNLQPQYLGLGLGLNNTTTDNARARAGEAEENNPFGRVMTYFMDRINPYPSQTAIDFLKGYTASLGADVVIHAFEIALDEKKTNWRYIQAILQGYEQNGYKTLIDVTDAEQRFKEEKEKRGQRQHSSKPESRATGKQFNVHYDVE